MNAHEFLEKVAGFSTSEEIEAKGDGPAEDDADTLDSLIVAARLIRDSTAHQIAVIAAQVDDYNEARRLAAIAWDMTGALGLDCIVQGDDIVIKKESLAQWWTEETSSSVLDSFDHYHPSWKPDDGHSRDNQ